MNQAAMIGPGETISEVFDFFAKSSPTSTVIVNDEQRVDYGELSAMVDHMSAYLVSKGAGKGDRVAILSNARAEVVVVFLSCARLGAIYLGLSPRLARPELIYALNDARPVVVFAADVLDGRDYGQIAAEACREAGVAEPLVFSAAQPSLSAEFRTIVDSPQPEPGSFCRPEETDPVALIYTSGSTGAPKGALLSHANLIISARAYMEHAGLARPRAISQLPIDHVGYVLCEMTAILVAGGTLIQLPRFEPRLLLSAIERHKATTILCIPTMIQRLIESGLLDDFDLSSLEFLWWAGPLPTSSVKTMQKYSKVLAVSYGMTEAAGTITFSLRDDAPEILCTTVGRPHSRLEVRVAAGGPDTPGEIQLRGPQIMKGYWNKPEETKAAFTEDGWFRTGDLGEFRGSNLAIIGRSKELIRSGGYNILPSEVEVALEEHDAVVMAFVSGVPDQTYGEAVHAIVHVREGINVSQEDLVQFLRSRISSIKIPKRIYLADSLPLLGNGKINRPSLRKKLVSDAARDLN